MNERITKKTVLITGGVRGIGLAIAKAFLEKGYDVYATYSKDEESAKNARNLRLANPNKFALNNFKTPCDLHEVFSYPFFDL